MEPRFDRYIHSQTNPLGIESEFFSPDEVYKTKIKLLEYKYNLNSLIEELQTSVKSAEDVGLVVVWEMGTKWREMFDAICLLDTDNMHHRQIHGTTHSLVHSVSGVHAFKAIILHDLVRYLKDPAAEVKRQRVFLDDQ